MATPELQRKVRRHGNELEAIYGYEVVFGPSNIVMQATDVAVADYYVRAAKVARWMPRYSALPLVARSRHLVNVVHGAWSKISS